MDWPVLYFIFMGAWHLFIGTSEDVLAEIAEEHKRTKWRDFLYMNTLFWTGWIALPISIIVYYATKDD